MPSSVIRLFSYDQGRRQLHVTFQTGRAYVYDEVPPEVYEDFVAASSKGTFFNQTIRDHYPYREITPAH